MSKTREKFLSFAGSEEGGNEDVVAVIDVSGTMGTSDLQPHRLGAGKESLRTFLRVKREQFPHHRMGIVSFSDTARIIHPLLAVSHASDSIEHAIGKLQVDGGTCIGAGLRQAVKLLAAGNSPHPPSGALRRLFGEAEGVDNGIVVRKIVFLGDGANTGGPDPEKEAEKAKRLGIVITVIGIGGSPHASSFDEPLLKRLASRDSKTGEPRYAFIKDTEILVETFKRLSRSLSLLEE